MDNNKKIKIISGWSNPGGSTVAFINLCNLFNHNGYDCTFYGPHAWHLGKCQSNTFEQANVNDPDEILLVHFLKLPEKPPQSQKVLLCTHETDIYPVWSVHRFWDDVVYVSESQQKWQRSEAVKHQAPLIQTPPDWCEGLVIPNVVSPLKKRDKYDSKAAVIGSVDKNKRTHKSIQRALEAGHEKVHLYGLVTDDTYYKRDVKRFVDQGKAVVEGFEQDKQHMYDGIGEVYHSSKRETFNFVKAECDRTGTKYDGLDSADAGAEYWGDEKILERWKECLDL